MQALDAFGKEWDARYPQISRSWRANWPNVATFFAYPEAIRKVIYTCMEFLREQNHLGQKRVGR
ncbi:transposase [Escherichia coli VL2874]|nr:transposase [Escherichia coli VL2874]